MRNVATKDAGNIVMLLQRGNKRLKPTAISRYRVLRKERAKWCPRQTDAKIPRSSMTKLLRWYFFESESRIVSRNRLQRTVR